MFSKKSIKEALLVLIAAGVFMPIEIGLRYYFGIKSSGRWPVSLSLVVVFLVICRIIMYVFNIKTKKLIEFESMAKEITELEAYLSSNTDLKYYQRHEYFEYLRAACKLSTHERLLMLKKIKEGKRQNGT